MLEWYINLFFFSSKMDNLASVSSTFFHYDSYGEKKVAPIFSNFFKPFISYESRNI